MNLFRHHKLYILSILFVFIITSGFGCKTDIFKSTTDKAYLTRVTLEYWGVWDTAAQVKTLTDAYKKLHPTITINYRRFRYEEYERKLLEAWAEDRGPDIFSIPVTWLKDYKNRFLLPAQPVLKVPAYEKVGQLKEETVLNVLEYPGIKPLDVQDQFVPVVYDDVILDGKVYGLPLYIDTMVTFYNRTLLDKAGIPEPMTNFHELVEQVPELTKVDTQGNIVQSAVALGGTDNIPRFFDILSNIMLQNGVTLKGQYFNPIHNKDASERLAGAFNYYNSFASPGKASYSWNDDMPDAFELFVNGKLAYFFGYSYHADQLKSRGVSFDWGMTTFPQARGTESTKYYANYWVNVVSKYTKYKQFSWSFVQTVSSVQDGILKDFLSTYNKPTPVRAFVNAQLENASVRAFARQVLTADNWYNGYDIDLAEEYTKDFVDSLLTGKVVQDNQFEYLESFVSKIQKTYVSQ